MKCISVHQPWASLIAVGAKTVETRHWPAPSALITRRVAIHASKTPREMRLVLTEPFRTVLHAAGFATGPLDEGRELPLGAVVATAELHRCRPITEDNALRLAATHPQEYAFGNYEAGRYAWILTDVRPLAEPVAFRGAQGFFDVPDDLIGVERQQEVALSPIEARGPAS